MTSDIYDPEVGQSPAELREAVALYEKVQPKRVLEIGVLYGGTLREWLRNASPELVVVVDPVHTAEDQYQVWKQPNTTLIVGRGPSQGDEMMELIRRHAPYDWVFIDGDHDHWAVQADADLCLPLVREGGHLLFHDVLYVPYPGRVFRALSADHKSWTIGAPRPPGYPVESANGIGVISV